MITLYAKVEVHCRHLLIKLVEVSNSEDFKLFECYRTITQNLTLIKELGVEVKEIVREERLVSIEQVESTVFEPFENFSDFLKILFKPRSVEVAYTE